MDSDNSPPTAFISYSWDDENHKDWVRDLATSLRRDGVDVKLDQWDTKPGDQLPQYMETAIRENNFVLIICTPKYKSKSNSRQGGAGYEGHVMAAELYNVNDQRKFIPIVRSNDGDASLPLWLAGKFYIDLSGTPYCGQAYSKLLSTIHGHQEPPPPIGQPPDFTTRSALQSVGASKNQNNKPNSELQQKGTESWNRFQTHRERTHLPRSIGGYRWTAAELIGSSPETLLDREFMESLNTRLPRLTGFPPWSFVGIDNPNSLAPRYDQSIHSWEAMHWLPEFSIFDYWQIGSNGYLFDVMAFDDDFEHQDGQQRLFNVPKQIDRLAETIWVATKLQANMGANSSDAIRFVFYWHHLTNRVAAPTFRTIHRAESAWSATGTVVPVGVKREELWPYVKDAMQMTLMVFDGLSISDDQYEKIVNDRLLQNAQIA